MYTAFHTGSCTDDVLQIIANFVEAHIDITG